MDPEIPLTRQQIREAERAADRKALRALNDSLWRGEDILEDVTDIEAVRELADSGIFPRADLGAHVRYELTDEHPEEQVYHEYHGDAPQDP